MVKYILYTLVILYFGIVLIGKAHSKRLHPESYYQNILCTELGGQTEVRNPDKTRVDCLTDTLAIEVDFSDHWAQCGNQARLYAAYTGKKPVLVVIPE